MKEYSLSQPYVYQGSVSFQFLIEILVSTPKHIKRGLSSYLSNWEIQTLLCPHLCLYFPVIHFVQLPWLRPYSVFDVSSSILFCSPGEGCDDVVKSSRNLSLLSDKQRKLTSLVLSLSSKVNVVGGMKKDGRDSEGIQFLSNPFVSSDFMLRIVILGKVKFKHLSYG